MGCNPLGDFGGADPGDPGPGRLSGDPEPGKHSGGSGDPLLLLPQPHKSLGGKDELVFPEQVQQLLHHSHLLPQFIERSSSLEEALDFSHKFLPTSWIKHQGTKLMGRLLGLGAHGRSRGHDLALAGVREQSGSPLAAQGTEETGQGRAGQALLGRGRYGPPMTNSSDWKSTSDVQSCLISLQTILRRTAHHLGTSNYGTKLCYNYYTKLVTKCK